MGLDSGRQMSAASRSFYLIVYDIVDDKRRLKVYKILNAAGERVQRSAFECYLTQVEFKKLMAKLKKIIHVKEDNLRVYFVCESCRPKISRIGTGKVVDPPDLMII